MIQYLNNNKSRIKCHLSFRAVSLDFLHQYKLNTHKRYFFHLLDKTPLFISLKRAFFHFHFHNLVYILLNALSDKRSVIFSEQKGKKNQ